MKQFTTIRELRLELKKHRSSTVGFVPTMGFLHEGHLSLVTRAKEECDLVVMSIFVNPLQFGPGEDFDRYPRDLARDSRLAEQAGVDILFTPTVEEMYPQPMKTSIVVNEVTEKLCGKFRPGHFEGVATVVSKLFHIVQPDRAYFGLKDAQQVAVIEQMVRDLHFPIEIVPCEIVRDDDGLAKSSRNVYLSEEERKQALILSRALWEAKEKIEKEEFRTREQVLQYVTDRIQSQPLADIDYVDLLSYPSLEIPEEINQTTIIIAVAVHFGKTRLIDNVLIRRSEGAGLHV